MHASSADLVVFDRCLPFLFSCIQLLKFSPDGKQIAITSAQGIIIILDAFSGQVLHMLRVPPSANTSGASGIRPSILTDATFTPDSQFLFIGKRQWPDQDGPCSTCRILR